MQTIKSFIALTVLSVCLSASVRAEEVRTHVGERIVSANLELASSKNLADGVVLLVHGTMAHAGMELIATQQALLAQRGLNSLAITLSLGRSERRGMYDCGAEHNHRHTDAIEEIRHWMAWLGEREAGPIVLAGHSRGGNQVARYALEAPQRLKALALIAPSTFDAARVEAGYQKRYAQALKGQLARAAGLADDAWMDAVPFLYCGPSRVTAAAFTSYYADDGLQDTPALLPSIIVPTLVIAGGADTTVPDVVARSEPHIDSDTRLAVIEDADHFFRDLYGEDLADALAAWLADLN